MKSVSAKERAWRNRNPELAKRFDRLPAAAKVNIRTAQFGAGTAKLVRSADVVRREREAERSRKRRQIARLRKLVQQTIGGPRPNFTTDDDEEIFWDLYDESL